MSDRKRKSIDDGDFVYQSFRGTRRKKIPLRSVYSCPSQPVSRGLRVTNQRPPQTNNVNEDPIQEERGRERVPVTQQPQTQESIDISSIQQMRSVQRTDDYDEQEAQGRSCCPSCSCLCCLHSMLYHCVWKDDIGYQRLSLKSLCRREDTCGKNMKKALILILFLPFLPCIIVGFIYRSLLK